MKIIVSSLALAPLIIQRERPSHLVSLLSPDEIGLAPGGHTPERHLRLPMHDVRETAEAETDQPPAPHHAVALIAFGRGWTAEAPLLVHCWAGISRSTAAAFTLACARNPKVEEKAIAWALREASPTAFPNPLLVAHADAALGRQGRMMAAIEAIGTPADFETAKPFFLPADFPRKG
jgi:predicted protein tyrosine phosphatase